MVDPDKQKESASDPLVSEGFEREKKRQDRKKEKLERQERDFLNSARVGDLKALNKTFRRFGERINVRDPDTQATALHYAAASRARKVLSWLGEREEIDYLLQDREGRLPSAVAYEVADDPIIGRYLAKKENEQARARGIDIRTFLTGDTSVPPMEPQ